MVIHELTTNAAKYGALSNGEGQIDARWNVRNDRFALAWSERGGPVVSEPEAEGFGMSLMQGEISYRLGGDVETKFDPAGLTVDLSFPLG
ncbi:two-component sensor histidine kinase [Rhizobium sp. BK109]